MMERLPLRAVPVPIESGGANVHVEVVSDLVEDHVEGGTMLGPLSSVIGDKMRISMPR